MHGGAKHVGGTLDSPPLPAPGSLGAGAGLPVEEGAAGGGSIGAGAEPRSFAASARPGSPASSLLVGAGPSESALPQAVAKSRKQVIEIVRIRFRASDERRCTAGASAAK